MSTRTLRVVAPEVCGRLSRLLAIFFFSTAAVSCAAPPSTASNPTKQQTSKLTMSTDQASKDDRHQILQLTIDLDVLAKYYHEEVAGRKPLQIVKSEVVPDGVALKKFGEPVRVIPRADVEGKGGAYLEIKKLEIDGTRAQVEFAYPVEGVQGTAKFQKTDTGWRVESRELHEH